MKYRIFSMLITGLVTGSLILSAGSLRPAYAQAATTFSNWTDVEKVVEAASIYYPESAYVPIEIPSRPVSKMIPIKSRTRVAPAPLEVTATRVKKLTERLEIFAQALMDGNIKGLAAKKYDEFTTEYLFAGGMELSMWLEDVRSDFDFQNIFKGNGPWILVFLAMSPTSMHEYLDEIDMPGGDSGALDVKRLPMDMYVRPAGDEIEVELWGAENLSVTFRINRKNEIRVV